MSMNPAFRRALHALAHPSSLGAIVVLLINDHWLRWVSPSWLTGKLGDFAWLVFAPFIAALALAWVIPPRLPKQEQLVAGLSFSVIGLWFALAKTVPAIHVLTSDAWESIIGWQGSLRMDVTDLLTLPALLVSLWIWKSVKHQPINLKPLAYVAFGLGIVATLASDGPYYSYSDSGITTICDTGTELVTITEAMPLLNYPTPSPDEPVNPDGPVPNVTRQYNVFTSDNGGLTWKQRLEANFEMPEGRCSDQNSVIDPRDETVRYRWQKGERVERSADGGQSWVTDYELLPLQQDVRRYYNHYTVLDDGLSGFNRSYLPSPVSGIVDDESDNLILAMSWDGVLVRTAEGEWRWVDVGENYRLAQIQRFDNEMLNTIFYEQWMAGAIGFLVVTTSIAYIRQKQLSWFRRMWLGLGWICWFGLAILILPDSKGTANFEALTMGLFSLPPLVLLAIPLSVAAVWDIVRNFRHLAVRIALSALGVAMLFLLPFIPWTQGTIPRYTTALMFALLLTVCGLASAFVYLRRALPVLEKLPPPEKEDKKLADSEG